MLQREVSTKSTYLEPNSDNGSETASEISDTQVTTRLAHTSGHHEFPNPCSRNKKNEQNRSSARWRTTQVRQNVHVTVTIFGMMENNKLSCIIDRGYTEMKRRDRGYTEMKRREQNRSRLI